MTYWDVYHLPASVDEALARLSDYSGGARVVAGGTDLLLEMQQGRKPRVTALIDVTRIPEMTSISAEGDDITIFGPTNVEVRGGALSFAFRDVHPHDLSQVLDQSNVCVRAGHHCAKPLMRQLGVGATARASFYVYNDVDDVDALVDGLAAAADFFAF